MDNIISFQNFATPTGGPSDQPCWACQKPISPRALFCHHCGSIQAVRDIDHFARLGMEPKIDLDPHLLEKQYNGFKKALNQSRFEVRGLKERELAARQLEVMNAAYETLRDPLKRGRYWMALHKKEFTEPGGENAVLAEMMGALDKAEKPSECDNVARRAGMLLEQGVLQMLQAFRGKNWQQAYEIIVELDGLEAVLEQVRLCRSKFTTTTDGHYLKLSEDYTGL